MATETKLGRTFIDKLITDHIEGKEIVVDVSMAKYWTMEMASRVADRCLQLSSAAMATARSTGSPAPGGTSAAPVSSPAPTRS